MPGYDSKLSTRVNTPFSKYPTRPCSRTLSWALGPCVNTFCVGFLALNPQFRNSEHVLNILNMNIFSDWVPWVWTQHILCGYLGASARAPSVHTASDQKPQTKTFFHIFASSRIWRESLAQMQQMLVINRTTAEQFNGGFLPKEGLYHLLENKRIIFIHTIVFYSYFLVLLFNLMVYYRFFIARILSVLPEIFRNWGGCRPPGSYAYEHKFV